MKVLALCLAVLALAAPVAAAPLPAVEQCYYVIDFPDLGHGLCVDSDGPCYLAYARITFAGETRICLVPPSG